MHIGRCGVKDPPRVDKRVMRGSVVDGTKPEVSLGLSHGEAPRHTIDSVIRICTTRMVDLSVLGWECTCRTLRSVGAEMEEGPPRRPIFVGAHMELLTEFSGGLPRPPNIIAT